MPRLILYILLLTGLQNAVQADPIWVSDLASKTEWTCKKESDTNWQPTEIPNQISMKASKDRWIEYRRTILAPQLVADQEIDLKLLSVNDGGEIFIDGQSAGTIDYGLFPCDVDISKWITPGKSATLTVRCFSRNHYYHGGAFPQDHNGDELLGMPRGVSLVIDSPVHITDAFVKPSVSDDSISYDLWIENHSSVVRTVQVRASFSPWNKGDSWNYPAVPSQTIELAPNTQTKFAQSPIKWLLGSSSFWWPNIPFRSDYQARLHNVHFTVTEKNAVLDKRTMRFGFVEHGEGSTFYTVNNVRIFQFQDGTQEHAWSANHHDGFQTAYEELAGWSSGAAETWRNYLRLGFNTFRLHNSAGSESMLDAADEVGFMIVGESGIRGYATPEESWDPVYKPAAIAAMVRTYRSHPSVFRYSLDNEWAAATKDAKIAAKLIDAATTQDPTRPLTFSQDKAPWVEDFFGSDHVHHAFVMDHYHMPATRPDAIAGVEEEYWDRKGTNRNELIECSRAAIMDRLDGLAVFSPWMLSNYWCNFIQGGGLRNGTVNPLWKNKDRRDGIDGWGSDIVGFMQNCYSVYACADVDLIQNHLNKENLIFDPKTAVEYQNQDRISRQMAVFNNSLTAHQMSISWEVHLDTAGGPLVNRGESKKTLLQPGEHTLQTVTFKCPSTGSQWRTIFFVVKTNVDSRVMFVEDRYFFKIKND